eukprot:753007-Hanusia_phi.AAC.4
MKKKKTNLILLPLIPLTLHIALFSRLLLISVLGQENIGHNIAAQTSRRRRVESCLLGKWKEMEPIRTHMHPVNSTCNVASLQEGEGSEGKSRMRGAGACREENRREEGRSWKKRVDKTRAGKASRGAET